MLSKRIWRLFSREPLGSGSRLSLTKTLAQNFYTFMSFSASQDSVLHVCLGSWGSYFPKIVGILLSSCELFPWPHHHPISWNSNKECQFRHLSIKFSSEEFSDLGGKWTRFGVSLFGMILFWHISVYINVISPFLETDPATSIQSHQACTSKCLSVLECLSSSGLCFVLEVSDIAQTLSKQARPTDLLGRQNPFSLPTKLASSCWIWDLFFTSGTFCVILAWLTFWVIYASIPVFLVSSTISFPALLQLLLSPDPKVEWSLWQQPFSFQ